MKFLVLVILLFYKSTGAIPNSCGDRAKFGRDWVLLCFSNPDKTLNVTFNCNLNRHQDDLHLRIWYHFYPAEMTSLTIQNCEKLNLAFDIEPRKYNQLRHLHVKNITTFAIDKGGNTRCLPQDVKFESIKEAHFSMPLISDNEFCTKNNYGSLQALQLINMTIKKLPSHFIWDETAKLTKLQKFVMENVQIEETENNSILIHDKYSTIEIINSTVNNMQDDFMDIDALFVILVNNTFVNLPKNRTFTIKGNEVRLEGNHFDLLSEDTLEISSNQMYIVSNVFNRIEENAFKNVKFSSNESYKYYNFLNNIIYSLSPRSITSPHGSITPTDSDYVDVYHNFVICSCSNLPWFDWLTRNHNHFNNKWFDKNNMNKCLNIPNCDLTQIPKNYMELCDGNYKCLNNGETGFQPPKGNVKTNDRVLINSDKGNTKANETKNLSAIERLLVTLEKNNNDTFRNNFEIIKLLWIESKKIKKN